jgi:Fur family ferric uptake transcriptional regulator
LIQALIEDIDVNLPQDLLTQIERRTGFRIESYTLQLNGRRTLED